MIINFIMSSSGQAELMKKISESDQQIEILLSQLNDKNSVINKMEIEKDAMGDK